jgi:hypothetical protein
MGFKGEKEGKGKRRKTVERRRRGRRGEEEGGTYLKSQAGEGRGEGREKERYKPVLIEIRLLKG